MLSLHINWLNNSTSNRTLLTDRGGGNRVEKEGGGVIEGEKETEKLYDRGIGCITATFL